MINKSPTTIKVYHETRRLLKMIAAYESKPMTAVIHELVSDKYKEFWDKMRGIE